MTRQKKAKKEKPPLSPTEKIKEKTRKTLEDYSLDGAKLDRDDIEAVVESLDWFIQTTGKTILSEYDVKKILDRLVVRNNPRSHETMVRWNAFKHAAEKLTNKKLVRCPRIRVPKPNRRHLIYETDDHILKNVPLIQALYDDLLALRPFEPDRARVKDFLEMDEKDWKNTSRLREKEIEYLCSFIASAAIFGKVLFDDFHRDILKIKCKDAYLNVCFVNLAYDNSNALRRFMLPYPASIYFMRCLRFYEKNAGRLGMKPLDKPGNDIFKNFEEKDKDQGKLTDRKFATLFRNWTKKRLAKLGYDCEEGLTIFEFRAAVKRSSFGDLANAIEYPPFLIAIQSNAEGIKSHSYGSCHLPYFIGAKAERNDYEEKHQNIFVTSSRLAGKKKAAAAGIMPELMDRIAKVRRRLAKDGMHTVEKRREVIAEIFDILAKSDLDPWSDDYHNVFLYLLWIEHMVMHSNMTFNSINAFASQVPRLLYQLSGIGALDSLSLGSLVENISQTIYLYYSAGIKKALRHFCIFLRKMGLKPFRNIKWHSKTLQKKDTPSMKAFIPFEDVKAALDKTKDFIARQANSINDPIKKQTYVQAALHNVKIYSLFIALGYYAGMRISEIIRLKCGDIKGERYLLITKSKTESGKRHIYLNPLLPGDLREAFLQYVRERKQSGARDQDFLFVRDDGKEWSYNRVSEDVARLFVNLGYKNFRFHHLRHCFANIFLFRWVHAFYGSDFGTGQIPTDAPIFKNELFQQKKVIEFKRLLFGLGANAKTGQHDMNFALYALSKLIGHAGPNVTLKEYIHCWDALFYLWSHESRNQKTLLTVRRAEDFMQTTLGSMTEPVTCEIGQTVTMKRLYELQKARMRNLPWSPEHDKKTLSYELW